MSKIKSNTKKSIKKELEESLIRIAEYKQRETYYKKNTLFKKYRFVSFDVETTGVNNDFYLCGVIDYDNNYHCFFKEEEAILFLKRLKHNDLIICATNLEFDFSVLFKDSKYFNKCDFIVNKGSFISVTLDGSYFKQKMIDTLNFGGLSVEKMGKILNLPKLEKPRALGKIPKNEEEKQELINYNKRDCEVTRDFMIYLQDVINHLGGQLQCTISSTALDVYTRKFLPMNVLREEIISGLKLKDKIYNAYYGGRTEAFGRGVINDYNYYDVNSLYPSVMLERFPVPDSVQYIFNSDITYLCFPGVSYFELEIPYSLYPMLPFRNDNKLVFPYGRIKGYYTHLEINHALKFYGNDIIKKMNDTIYYTKEDYFFKDYVITMYNKRKEEKAKGSFLEVFYKLLLNSLYGRFALRNIGKTNFFIAENDDVVKDKLSYCDKNTKIKVNPGSVSYFTKNEEYDGNNSIPIWSVYITSYARIKMFDLILLSNPIYMDTDSLITKNIIKDSKELGELKLEKVIKSGLIIKPKMYFMDSEAKVKGVRLPKSDIELLEVKNKLLNNETIIYEKFVKLKEGIIQHKNINSIVNVEKNIDLEDNKRDWEGKKFDKKGFQMSKPLKVKTW